ncbi:MAG: transcriptional repressor [Clostridiales bacterium]|nr:transcriptional repressor [Clostridiales bacterium]
MAENKNNDSLRTAFQSYLKENGLRDTYERRVIIEAITNSKGHFNLDNLSADIIESGHQVSRATIYNTVGLLVKASLVRRQQFDNGTHFYECTYRMPSGNQLHMVCINCGKVTELRNASVARELSMMKFGSFAPRYIALSVYGMCSQCTRKMRKEN